MNSPWLVGSSDITCQWFRARLKPRARPWKNLRPRRSIITFAMPIRAVAKNRMIITGAEEDTFYRHFVPLSLVIILNVMALQANRSAEFRYSYNKRSLRGLATDRFPTRHFLVTKLVVERKK